MSPLGTVLVALVVSVGVNACVIGVAAVMVRRTIRRMLPGSMITSMTSTAAPWPISDTVKEGRA